MHTGGPPDCGLGVAVDVHDLSTGGARAAAAPAADANFAPVLAGRTAAVPRAAPCRPGVFSLRQPPPRRAVLADLSGPGLLAAGGTPNWTPMAGPAPAPTSTPSPASGDRGSYIPVPHAYPPGAGSAGIPGAPVDRHRGRDARRRRRGPGRAHGRPVPAARALRRAGTPRAGRPDRSHHDRPPARLTYPDGRYAASACDSSRRCHAWSCKFWSRAGGYPSAGHSYSVWVVLSCVTPRSWPRRARRSSRHLLRRLASRHRDRRHGDTFQFAVRDRRTAQRHFRGLQLLVHPDGWATLELTRRCACPALPASDELAPPGCHSLKGIGAPLATRRLPK